MREIDLQRQILRVLSYSSREVPVFWRNNSGAITVPSGKGRPRFLRFGLVGSSDILGVLWDGRFMAIEVKVGRNKPTAAQAGFLNKISKAGGVAFVARSVEDVLAFLEREKTNRLRRNHE